MRILCVDDEETFAKDIGNWLNDKFQTLDWIYVPTLEKGLRELASTKNTEREYDVLILDLLLPGETLGLYFIPKLREDFPNLTIIGLSPGAKGDNHALYVGKKTYITAKSNAQNTILDTLRSVESGYG